MPSSLFRIDEYKVPCQHIRQYPRATRGSQEEVLHIAVKQYTPLNNPHPKKGDVTVIGTQANGFPKEVYEPLWEDLLERTNAAGFAIRSIWIADVAQQGQSGVLNEGKLGNDPSWFDHPRDLLNMINHFRDQMPRPIVGIGHSMGGNHLVNLSLIHPRLFETIVLIDPVVQRFTNAQGNYQPAYASSIRRDRWPSRDEARKAFLRSKFYQAWDPRVMDRWIAYGLRELPTELYPEHQPIQQAPATPEAAANAPTEPQREVTLTTTKHSEVFTFLRPHFLERDKQGLTVVNPDMERLTHPDLDLREHPSSPFYRPEPIITFHNLPFVRPSVLYVFGEDSHLSKPELCNDKLSMTGIGVSGSGGVKAGRVKGVMLKKGGHLMPMEQVGEVADNCCNWLDAELKRFAANEAIQDGVWEKVKDKEKYTLNERYLKELKTDNVAKLEKIENEKQAKKKAETMRQSKL
ncbi:hypothetical protein NA57DRAFT_80054 [Rhizodiscina lignyota]|uniref:AB hydrolase-1 domain-containing protein n=1 Tax=Rhizodiscina lignyota TaxID=1504668 RepID=A0A9P4M2S4_9PEZI|nr:hypothetical protein NA57DRAFT_80054 [Rhizodiscina lignyota]